MNDKPMTVDALMAMVQQFALAHFNPSLASTTLDEHRHSLRAAIEQYGRERAERDAIAEWNTRSLGVALKPSAVGATSTSVFGGPTEKGTI